jgi:ribosomal protein S27AE
MYYRIEITRVEEAFACPNCSSPVRVVHHSARLYGECTCGAKMEFIQRKPIHVPKVMLNLDPPTTGRFRTISDRFGDATASS